jgi:hypothetical protein
MVFAITKMNHDKAFARPVPVPGLKPVSNIEINTISPSFNLDLSTSAEAGQYRRLRVDQFLAAMPAIPERSPLDVTPSALAGLGSGPPNTSLTVNQPLPEQADFTSERQDFERDTQDETLKKTTHFYLNDNTLSRADTAQTSLPYLPQINESRFIDRVIDMAEASPIQPDSRGCGSLNHSLNAAPKYDKVRSVGMERQITGRTSIGVEFVYKDGCYKKAIAPLKAAKMPGDDGVNLRVNMRF